MHATDNPLPNRFHLVINPLGGGGGGGGNSKACMPNIFLWTGDEAILVY